MEGKPAKFSGPVSKKWQLWKLWNRFRNAPRLFLTSQRLEQNRKLVGFFCSHLTCTKTLFLKSLYCLYHFHLLGTLRKSCFECAKENSRGSFTCAHALHRHPPMIKIPPGVSPQATSGMPLGTPQWGGRRFCRRRAADRHQMGHWEGTFCLHAFQYFSNFFHK